MEFDVAAFEDLAWWVEKDRAQALRIIRLIREMQREPFAGLGKPEPLKHDLKGCWFRRIDQEHRLVYQVHDDKIRILARRYDCFLAIVRQADNASTWRKRQWS